MAKTFSSKVYALVMRIPAGYVYTYGQIARDIGHPRAARQVGTAMRFANDERMPCHRVVNKQGMLSPAYVFGNPHIQRQLLEQEGVAFLPDGRIDLNAHLWDGALHEGM